MVRTLTILAALVCVAASGADTLAPDFDGVSAVAAALRKSDLEVERDAAALGIVVRGPTSAEQVKQPLVAEVRSRGGPVDLLAGLQADRTTAGSGSAGWIGGVALANDHERGCEAVEVRTSVGRHGAWEAVGLEFGPRIERLLPGGITLFVDGKAEAVSMGGQMVGVRVLPGQPTDGIGLIGVAGRTGLLR